MRDTDNVYLVVCLTKVICETQIPPDASTTKVSGVVSKGRGLIHLGSCARSVQLCISIGVTLFDCRNGQTGTAYLFFL